MTSARASGYTVKTHKDMRLLQKKAGDISDAVGFQGGLIVPRNDQGAMICS